MEQTKGFTSDEASGIADLLGLDLSKEAFDLEQFRMGLGVELELARFRHERHERRPGRHGQDRARAPARDARLLHEAYRHGGGGRFLSDTPTLAAQPLRRPGT